MGSIERQRKYRKQQWVKEQERLYRKEYRKRPSVILKLRKAFAKYRKKNSELKLSLTREWRRKNPERVRSHNVANRLLRLGRIERKFFCEICNSGGRLVKHHKDYSKPSEITWLCSSCHTKEHMKGNLK